MQDREVVICVSPADIKLIEIKTRSSRQALWVKKIMSCSNSFRQSQEKHRETWVHGTEFGVCQYTSAPLHTRIRRKGSSILDRLLSGPDCTQWERYTPSQSVTSQPPGAGLLLDAPEGGSGEHRKLIVSSRSAMHFPTVWQRCGNQLQNPPLS